MPPRGNRSQRKFEDYVPNVLPHVWDFVDEVPQDFHRERKAVSEKLLEATEQALPIVQALTADDATADLNQEAVEQLMAVFQDRVTNAMAQEERTHPAALHEWLREAIVSVMETKPR